MSNAKYLPDYRNLFNRWVSRKAGLWDGIQLLPRLTEAQFAALAQLPVISFESDSVSPLEDRADFFDTDSRGFRSLEFVAFVKRAPVGPAHPPRDLVQVFYVNSEGYPYARYAARIQNADVPKLVSMKFLQEILKKYNHYSR